MIHARHQRVQQRVEHDARGGEAALTSDLSREICPTSPSVKAISSTESVRPEGASSLETDG